MRFAVAGDGLLAVLDKEDNALGAIDVIVGHERGAQGVFYGTGQASGAACIADRMKTYAAPPEKIAHLAKADGYGCGGVDRDRRKRGDRFGLCEIGFGKGGLQCEFGVGNEEFLIVDHQKTVDFFDQDLNAVERAVDVFDAFEEKWRGDDRCCGNAETSCDACDDRCATGADTSAETGK